MDFVVRHAPLPQLGLDAGGRSLNQQRGKALIRDARWQLGTVVSDKLKALFDPAHQIFAYVIKHSHFRVSAVE